MVKAKRLEIHKACLDLSVTREIVLNKLKQLGQRMVEQLVMKELSEIKLPARMTSNIV
jgi:DNA topoisomerase VI subunit A